MHIFNNPYLRELSRELKQNIEHIVRTDYINEDDLNSLARTVLEFDMESEFEALVQYCISNNQYDLLHDFTNCLNKIQSRENPEFWITIFQKGLLSLDDEKISVIINTLLNKVIHNYYNPIQISPEGVDYLKEEHSKLTKSVIIPEEVPNYFDGIPLGQVSYLGGTLYEEIPGVFFLSAISLPLGTSLKTLNTEGINTDGLILNSKKYYVDWWKICKVFV